MNTHFEWMRILLAIGMMTFAFVLLPMFFLHRDRKARERTQVTVGRRPDDTSSG